MSGFRKFCRFALTGLVACAIVYTLVLLLGNVELLCDYTQRYKSSLIDAKEYYGFQQSYRLGGLCLMIFFLAPWASERVSSSWAMLFRCLPGCIGAMIILGATTMLPIGSVSIEAFALSVYVGTAFCGFGVLSFVGLAHVSYKETLSA